MNTNIYKQEYTNSWALVIGINKYQNVSHLYYARNDAEAISTLLINKFNFPKENVTTLYDDEATRDAIMKSYMRFAREDVNADDKIFIFFAGHGHTIRGLRNDIGYLVPVDANLQDLSTFIRWDELTRNSEIIQAKHIFFVMDACFSGLAITRAFKSGSMRYLKDMLQRYSVQVLTAGKADEPVADANGPIPEHSIFTGYLIQALEGNAYINEGILTANNIMSYVFSKVSKDDYSNQTPHYGYFSGDGDFIFQAPVLDKLKNDEHIDNDILIEMLNRQELTDEKTDIIEDVKQYISDERYKIKLDTLVTKELRHFLELTGNDNMPMGTKNTNENIIERIKNYEKSIYNTQSILIVLSHWGIKSYVPILKKLITRTTDNIIMESGSTAWLYLRWYPALVMIYSGGISAIAADNYEMLNKIFTTKVISEQSNNKSSQFIESVVKATLELDRMNIFKLIPGHDKYFAPRSEYLFKLLQPILDDILFLGKSYENIFDRFEVFYALVFMDLTYETNGNWGPPGRFAWKYSRSFGNSVYEDIENEARLYRDDWLPLKAGMFSGSYERFNKIATEYKLLINNLGWR